MKQRKTLIVIVATSALYLIFPLLAGLIGLGDRDGPKIYPKTYHSILYMLSYEAVRDEKPRENLFYERPWFYGLPRKRREITDDASQR